MRALPRSSQLQRKVQKASGITVTTTEPRDTPEPPSSILKIILLLEFMALMIGLAMPVTPSKTGSDASLADWFFDDPGYLQEVFVYFVFTNILLGMILGAAWVWQHFQRPSTADAAETEQGAEPPSQR